MLEIDGLTKEELAVVYTTAYKPSIDEDGILSIQTTFDALGSFSQAPETFTFRNTIHTSLNGTVGSHMQGNWDDMDMLLFPR